MKRKIIGILTGILIAGAMVGCGTDGAKQVASQTDDADPIFVKSGWIQEYEGDVYTVLSMNEDADMIKVPGTYLSEMLVYKDHIYYTDVNGTGGGPTELFRSNLDGSELTVLLTDISSWDSFCVYDNELYYTACDWTSGALYYSRSMNLDTLDIQDHEYCFVDGSAEAWIVRKEIGYDNQQFCCSLGYENVKEVPDGSDWEAVGVEGAGRGIFGVHGADMFYLKDYAVLRDSIYSEEDDAYSMTESDVTALQFACVEGDGLYYLSGRDSYLHRMDLVTMEEKAYDILNYLPEDMWSWFYWSSCEVNGKFYFTALTEDYASGTVAENIECWELDLDTGSCRSVGMWFES